MNSYFTYIFKVISLKRPFIVHDPALCVSLLNPFSLIDVIMMMVGSDSRN